MADENNNLQAVIDIAGTAAQPKTLYEGPGFAKVFVPSADGPGRGRVVDLDLEKVAAVPVRKRGTVKVFDAASLNQLIADNSDAGNIAIYLDRNPISPSIVAVLNGHGKNGPGWGDFRVQIEFRPTPQWKKWQGIDGKMLPQTDFAEFIEDNMIDVTEPAGAKLLEIVTFLEVTRAVEFKSAVNLGRGTVQFQHNEDDTAKVAKGAMDVPTQFTITLCPMLGSGPYEIPARFRYRLNGGKLTLGIKIERPETLMDKLIEAVVSKIERGANISVLDGLPP